MTCLQNTETIRRIWTRYSATLKIIDMSAESAERRLYIKVRFPRLVSEKTLDKISEIIRDRLGLGAVKIAPVFFFVAVLG